MVRLLLGRHLLLVALALPMLVAACGDTGVDSATATVTPRTGRDSVILRDSTIYDTIDVPVLRGTRRTGKIYFRPGLTAPFTDSLDLIIDSLSYADVRKEGGATTTVRIRLMARVPEAPPRLNPRGVPSWIYLYVDRLELGNDGKGERALQGDPRYDQTGLALFVRPPWGEELLVTNGPGHGRVMVDRVSTSDRVVYANIKTNFTGQKPLVVDSVAVQIGY